MEHSIYILALPLLSFILLALAGNKMPHKVAGTIGTLSLLAATVPAYTVTIGYFAAGRDAEGIFAEALDFPSYQLKEVFCYRPSERNIHNANFLPWHESCQPHRFPSSPSQIELRYRALPNNICLL